MSTFSWMLAIRKSLEPLKINKEVTKETVINKMKTVAIDEVLFLKNPIQPYFMILLRETIILG